jgi:hypothetical protein
MTEHSALDHLWLIPVAVTLFWATAQEGAMASEVWDRYRRFRRETRAYYRAGATKKALASQKETRRAFVILVASAAIFVLTAISLWLVTANLLGVWPA